MGDMRELRCATQERSSQEPKTLPAKECLAAFVEASAEARRISELGLMRHQNRERRGE